ncbi:hypothetical protein GV64_12375 [Endozoicomonas elysicola]|uniref:Uncharacterized protein n=1 Tax=Endozoicomonas elysicola TaxID=305900 RepID=A0A081KBA3_9GAMM|nr:hypothetical protein GV64_12375 [Endozoicomonas elysicola]
MPCSTTKNFFTVPQTIEITCLKDKVIIIEPTHNKKFQGKITAPAALPLNLALYAQSAYAR